MTNDIHIATTDLREILEYIQTARTLITLVDDPTGSLASADAKLNVAMGKLNELAPLPLSHDPDLARRTRKKTAPFRIAGLTPVQGED